MGLPSIPNNKLSENVYLEELSSVDHDVANRRYRVNMQYVGALSVLLCRNCRLPAVKLLEV
jgi:hypothetical protein